MSEERVNKAGVSFISLLFFVPNLTSSDLTVAIVAFFGAGENKPPKGCRQKDCWSGGTLGAAADGEGPRPCIEMVIISGESGTSKVSR